MSEGNPFALIGKAAQGDIKAQRALAQMASERVLQQCQLAMAAQQAGLEVSLSVQDGITLIEGLVFARMAAAHGDAGDTNLLLGLLSVTELFLAGEEAAQPIAEMLARAALIAERGNPDAETFTDVSVAQASPEIVALSQQYRRLILESEAA